MSERREYTCVVCPNGCPLQVETSGGEKAKLVSVTGNLCPRGARWAKQEVEDPRRTIATNVLVEGGTLPLASVRTLDAVPLKNIMAVRESLKGIVLHAPVRAGDIVADHPAGVPCRVAVTRHVPRKD